MGQSVLGDVQAAKDGTVNGWCWAPDRPEERLTVEFLRNGEVIGSVTASRFREDLRHKKYGDGYHGFVITLGQAVAAGGDGALLAARERVSGAVFWQVLMGEVAIPPGFDDRISAITAGLEDSAGNAAWTTPAPLAAFGQGVTALGERCLARGGIFSPVLEPGLVFAPLVSPELSVILAAAPRAAETIAALRVFSDVAADFVVLDDGGDPEFLLLQAQIHGLTYLHLPQASPARLRQAGAEAARGAYFVFLQGAGDVTGLDTSRMVIPGALAEAAGLRGLETVAAPAGLELGVPRLVFEALGGFDLAMDDGAGLELVDFVLRAVRLDVAMAVAPGWPCVARGVTNPAAQEAFMARWAIATP
jgi:hypothetical protein